MRRIKRNRPTIGVLAGWQTYPGTIHSFLDHVFKGIQEASRDFDCNLMIGCAVNSPFYSHESQVMPLSLPGTDFIPVGPWNTDGIVVIGPLFNEPADRYFQDLIDAGFPIVYAGDRETSPSVVVDNEGGIQLAVDHLVEHGHRRVAFIAGYNYPYGDSAARWRGYREGLRRHGIPYNPELVAVGEHLSGPSYRAMQEILDRGTPFSAVIASNDDSAVGAIQALRENGLVVAQDVAVIGFDDRLEARAEVPLLTTVHLPMFELGYQSLELLAKIIQGEAPADSLIRISTNLVIRESCGCLPGNQPLFDSPPNNINDLKPPTLYPEFHGPYRLGSDYSLLSEKVSRKVILPEISAEMAERVYGEMQRMGRPEVAYLCQGLLEAFTFGLEQNDATIFELAMQQVLEHVASLDGDLYAWHGAVSILRKWAPALLQSISPPNISVLAEHMLHQARIAISEVLRGQYSRLVMRETTISNLIGQMGARFFSASNEADVFRILTDYLDPLHIQSATIFYYQSEGQDLYAFSEIKTLLPANGAPAIFRTREFPPAGLFQDDRAVQLALLPLFKPDGMLGYVAFQTGDLSPLGQVTRQLVAALHNVRLYQDTVEARRQAEEANQQKSRFLSVVSHELRTPLSLIFGLSNMMLEESEIISDQERLVNTIDLQRIFIGAQHLESLIRDVLDLARSDVGKLNLIIEPVDLRDVLEGAAAIGEQLASDKGLVWQTIVPADLPFVKADRTRVRQIVLNLVNNAVKFTVQGGITLSAYADDSQVTVLVSDTGLGIPSEEQCAIFDEYHQSKRTTTRGYGGLGLGLSICKRLVEMQGGKIGVSSSGCEGSGSVFFFSLPLYTTGAMPDQPHTKQALRTLPGPYRQHILILVKDLDGSASLKNHLLGQGFKVDLQLVHRPDDWLTQIKSSPPDRILIDLGLTSEHGWEILKILKDNSLSSDIPLLFFTLNKDFDQGALLDLNYLTKPLSSADLVGELTARGLSLIGGDCDQNRPILIVDDDPEFLNLHTRILEMVAGGYPILHARNGREALEIIRKERPALVLLDLMMPEMDGFEVLDVMQSEDLSRRTPVIVLTGQVLTEEDMARLNNGVASVLGKGMFTTQETLDHITNALARKRRPGTEAHNIVLKAIAYLHTHYKDPISRAQIALSIGVSDRHLSRCFQQEIGVTPIAYLNRLRVRIAKTLLETGNKSITDIALDVGFSTGGYFARVFREVEGVSPREYLSGRKPS
jgi:signal transduction histidine kinase/DNA-binding LacI/PurR family transcriptional regulator/DNA-binding response OmpR family regulator